MFSVFSDILRKVWKLNKMFIFIIEMFIWFCCQIWHYFAFNSLAYYSYPSSKLLYSFYSRTFRPWSTFSSSLYSHGSCTREPRVEWKRSSFGQAFKNFSSPFDLCSVWTAETQKHSFLLRSVSYSECLLLEGTFSCLSRWFTCPTLWCSVRLCQT